MSSLLGLFRRPANAVRNSALTQEQRKERAEMKKLLSTVQVAAVVAAIANTILSLIFLNLVGLALAAVSIFAAREVYIAADNSLEILNNGAKELLARSSKEDFYRQIDKGTIVLGPLLRAIDPPLDQIIFTNIID